jgi:ATP-binding cassette, subfamily C, bacterial
MSSRPLSSLRASLGGAFAFAGFITLFVNIGILFVPLYDMILYDRVLQSKNMDTVTLLTVGVAVGMAIYGALEFCRSSLFVIIADRLARRLNIPTLQAAIAKSLAGKASAATQAMRDLNQLRLFASGQAAMIPLDLLWSPMLLAVLFLLHPAYGAYGFVCATLLFLLSALSDFATREDLLQANAANAAALNDLSTALRNSELIDGMGMLPDVARRWTHRQAGVLDTLGRATRRNKQFIAVAKTLRLAMQAGVIALGVTLVLHGQATPGSMMGSNLLIAKLLLPFEQLITAWRQWTSALGAWRRVRDLVECEAEQAAGTVPAKIEGRLIVEHLSFTPPGSSKAILQDISFSIAPGEAVGILGSSGSGKSTLARLVMGIFAPSAGSICLDGIAPSSWDRAAFGRHVGYLPQSISLLDGTIVDNIARMQDDDPALAIDAATRAGVHDLIGRLPDGYTTWIGGAGHALSGGQRQRVAMARALYGTPKLLVLDEPNSNLDHDGEQALIRTVRDAKLAGASVLLITHRPALLAAVDRVIALDKGRIQRIEPASSNVIPTIVQGALASAEHELLDQPVPA